ncbi:uncharacterized protein LOC109855501 isoform X2 [Pseudomyrmex gracilis]|uniref:uncharacterized protein LOC109855501 isoform X2 n=1 Tax=Pseudomyrmex gracilis TaxID=219809 RepID=UPI000994B860|nr:uncharacterized protein LOC109855501 isoform X2 [Pseudomyrmex gracilis]
MGNAKSAQSPGVQKDQKKDTRNDGQTASGRARAGKGDATIVHDDIRATNPFIIFFLRLRNRKPKEHVTVVARAAGKLWCQMTPEQRKKYVDLANEEKKRRQERKRKRKRLSTRTRMR